MKWIDLVIDLVRFCVYIVAFLCLLLGDELGTTNKKVKRDVLKQVCNHGISKFACSLLAQQSYDKNNMHTKIIY